MRICWIIGITSTWIGGRRGGGRSSGGGGGSWGRFEIQNRGEDLSGTRSNETSGGDNETREPIRALRLRRRSWSVVWGSGSGGGGSAGSDHFAARLRSEDGSHVGVVGAEHDTRSSFAAAFCFHHFSQFYLLRLFCLWTPSKPHFPETDAEFDCCSGYLRFIAFFLSVLTKNKKGLSVCVPGKSLRFFFWLKSLRYYSLQCFHYLFFWQVFSLFNVFITFLLRLKFFNI